jgi:AraC-like DNA-binding protein
MLALVLDRALLDAPVIRDEADLDRFLRDSPQVWYLTRDHGSTTADQVRKILERGLTGTWPTPEEVAAKLAFSAQHLRRLLREENTSMTEIKEEILRDAAIASLARGEESVEDLSTRLGFSESRAFRRAFNRWTGVAPSAYRGEAPSEQPRDIRCR